MSLRTRWVSSVAVLCLAAPVALSVTASSPAGADPAPAASSPSVRVVRPGQIGRARAGMTVARAMATGEFAKDVPNPPCGPVRLQPKGRWKKQYVVFATGRIHEMDAFGKRVRTTKGIGVGSTVRQVRRAYGAQLSEATEAGYQQWALFLHTGRRWIGFLFGEAFPSQGPLKRSDKVTLVGVTKGQRPALMIDGC